MKRVLAIAAALFSALAAGSFAGCAPQHEHTLTHVSAQQSYCQRQGNIEYWVCDECGKYYADEAATQEIALEDTVLPYHHQLEFVEAVTSDDVFSCEAVAHYECDVCGAYFADEEGAQPIDEADIFTTKTFALTDATITDTASSAQTVRVFAVNGEENLELAVTERKFVMRVFLGWEGLDFGEIMASVGVGARVNLNIDTQGNLDSGRWMSFRIGCNSQGCYAYFSDGKEIYFDTLTGGAALTDAMVEQSGLYVTIVRNGGLMAAYADDLAGNAVLISSSSGFTDTALVKCTLGVHQGYYASEEHPAVLKEGVLVIGTTDPAAAKA